MPAPVEDVLIIEEECDQLAGLSYYKAPMKHSDTRDSISSTDSDISLTYDKDGERRSSATSDEGANLADTSDCGSDTGSNTGKDSGCEVTEDTEPPFVPPDDELADRIVSQVEFYFSDVNITKDAFLLKHVKRNKEGYVSLKLISSFKRVKHIAKDWRVVAWALARSSKLQINEAGTKLRRTDPLPEYDQTTPSRTVVATHLPNDKPTIENVADLFSCFGDIALVRILRPGNPIPADVRQFVAKRPELSGVVCALVEFVRTESARAAIDAKDPTWRGHSQGIKVLELGAKKRSASNKKISATARIIESECSSCTSSSEAETEKRVKPRQRHSISGRPTPAQQNHPWASRRASGPPESSRPRINSLIQITRPRSNSGASHLPENILRLPKGPDGTKGFNPIFRQTRQILSVC